MKGSFTSSKQSKLHILVWVLGLILIPNLSQGQVIPTENTVQCFQVGEGALFTDIGGPGGDPTIEGAPGNYPNCDCVTTTTICAPDGSAVTANLIEFGIFASFDWLVILDIDNPLEEVYPSSILVDPLNVNFQLFNNADGVGDGGSENYGPGAQVGASTLADLPSTSFTATNPTGCLTFVFRASGVVDDPGWDALIATSSNVAHPGDNIECDANIACFPPSNLVTTDLTFESSTITWNLSPSTNDYILEYGPTGFTPGTGTTVNVTGDTYTITGLDENTTYDVYLQGDCGADGLSANVGPFMFTTEFEFPPSTCTYTINLFDSFGDGWNGSQLTITINGNSEVFTITTGTFETFTIDVFDGVPLIIEYSPGTFEGEVTYEILDSDGNLFFSDGPNPQIGLVYDEIAVCPDCPAPNSNSLALVMVDQTTAEITWDDNSAAESYTLEYGPEGFPLGIGLTTTVDNPPALLTGLNPCVNYDVYLTAYCGPDSLSTTIGPLNFQTEAEIGAFGDPCTYSLELFDSFGDGWNGSTLTVIVNGVATDYTFFTGNEAFFDFTALANQPITIIYTPGTFENEVTFNIIDPDGNTIYSDGPFPQTGEILNFLACPTCPGPTVFEALDINADNASFVWNAADATGTYTLEYGPFGFTLGTGTTSNPTGTEATITGLQEGTWYDIYLSFDCDDGESSKTLGPITFQTIWFVDVGVSGISAPTEADCNLSSSETVTIEMTNFGQLPQTLIPFFYAVNGVPVGIPIPTDGLYTGVIGNDSTETISFETTFDFFAPGYYLIEAWTELEGDSDLANDTFRVEVITATPLPLKEDFEDGLFPEGWTTDEFNPVVGPGAHNNPTWNLADNNWSFDPQFIVTTIRVGPLGVNDSLTFDYRYVDFFAGTTATILAGDMMEVQLSTDCGETYETVYVIDESNHVPSLDFANVVVDLSAYEGEAINLQFIQTWASGDYWTDIDNINISGCPNTFLASSNIVNATNQASADGSITVSPQLGEGPFNYDWSNGGSGATISDLAPGDYSVVITDVNGCTETYFYSVGVELVDAEEVPGFLSSVRLMPNPTTGMATLQVRLTESTDLNVQVFNAVGQELIHVQKSDVLEDRFELDLNAYPGGMYFVRLSSGEKMHIES